MPSDRCGTAPIDGAESPDDNGKSSREMREIHAPPHPLPFVRGVHSVTPHHDGQGSVSTHKYGSAEGVCLSPGSPRPRVANLLDRTEPGERYVFMKPKLSFIGFFSVVVMLAGAAAFAPEPTSLKKWQKGKGWGWV